MQSLIDLFIDFIDYFVFWVVIDEYERAGVFRLGLYNRTLEPGFHWVRPFGVDDVQAVNVVVDSEVCDPQTVDTGDDLTVVVTPVVTWEIHDTQAFLTLCEDSDGLIEDKVACTIAEQISVTEYTEIFDESFWHEIGKKARRELKPYGVHLRRVRYKDLARIRTYRLIQE